MARYTEGSACEQSRLEVGEVFPNEPYTSQRHCADCPFGVHILEGRDLLAGTSKSPVSLISPHQHNTAHLLANHD